MPQRQDDIAVLAVVVGPDDDALGESLVAPGHASTHGCTDPIYR